MDKSSLAHTTWRCKYHVVFAPKYRRRIIFGKLRADIVLAPGIFNHKNAGDFNQIPPELSGQFLPK